MPYLERRLGADALEASDRVSVVCAYFPNEAEYSVLLRLLLEPLPRCESPEDTVLRRVRSPGRGKGAAGVFGSAGAGDAAGGRGGRGLLRSGGVMCSYCSTISPTSSST